MSKKTYYNTASTLFTVIAFLHLFRALNQWEAVVAGVPIPVWISWVAVLLAGYLAVRGFSYVRKNPKMKSRRRA